MTIAPDRVFTRPPNRAHPHSLRHPRSHTLLVCVDHTSAPAEFGTVRYSDSDGMLAAVRKELTARMKAMEISRMPLKVDETRPAWVVFIDAPLELLSGTKARKFVQEVVDASASTGIYVALALTPAERQQLCGSRWGTALLERLRRDQAGYPVYGCW